MNLKLICTNYGLSRRAIQGYEKIGLVTPTCKTKHGYLLYDEQQIGKILFIKLCQEIGFKVKEIAKFIDKPNEEIQTIMMSKIKEHEEELKKKLENLDLAKQIANSFDSSDYSKLLNEIVKEKV